MRDWWDSLKKKVEEEKKQIKEEGVAGWFAGNVTTVAAKVAKGLGLEKTAEAIRSERPDNVASAQEFAGKVEQRVEKEKNKLKKRGMQVGMSVIQLQ